MTSEMIGYGPTLTNLEIDAMETRTGRQVPPRYRDFLLQHNGGHPDPSDFVFSNPHRENSELDSTVEMFLGIGVDEETWTIEWNLQVHENRIPEDLYPIATDPGGNMICMGTEDTNAGEIVFWDHEEEEETDEGEPPTRRNLYHVADNLDEFLNNLRWG